jgi:ribosomal protein L25 (general stress protein Ctc)
LTYLKEERKKDGKGERNRRKKDKTHTPCIAYTGKGENKSIKNRNSSISLLQTTT